MQVLRTVELEYVACSQIVLPLPETSPSQLLVHTSLELE